jgi:hypothetical protein
MKPADALSKDARALLRAARGGDDIPAAERQRMLEAFRQRVAADAAVEKGASAPRLHGAPALRSKHRRALPRPVRRVAWALAAVISTGSLAALAREGAFEGWGAAIERMLGTLASESSTRGAERAPEAPAARGVSLPGATEAKVAEPAVVVEPVRSADEPARPVPESSSDAERATRPAGEGLPAADAAEQLGPQPSADSSAPAAAEVATVPVRAARPQTSRASRLKPIELRRQPARAVRAEPSSSRANTPALQPAPASEELELVVTARNALAARRHAEARAAAERHARQFPSGVFTEEREAILALCACRETGASERARSFIDQRPDSLFAERIREDCKLVANLVPGRPPAGTH